MHIMDKGLKPYHHANQLIHLNIPPSKLVALHEIPEN